MTIIFGLSDVLKRFVFTFTPVKGAQITDPIGSLPPLPRRAGRKKPKCDDERKNEARSGALGEIECESSDCNRIDYYDYSMHVERPDARRRKSHEINFHLGSHRLHSPREPRAVRRLECKSIECSDKIFRLIAYALRCRARGGVESRRGKGKSGNGNSAPRRIMPFFGRSSLDVVYRTKALLRISPAVFAANTFGDERKIFRDEKRQRTAAHYYLYSFPTDPLSRCLAFRAWHSQN